MDFFQKLGNTLSNTGKDIAKKTKDFSDTSKLNHEISRNQDIINQAYSQIGKLYFENYSNLDYPELKDLCTSITDANTKINDLKKEITLIKGFTTCPQCGAEVATTATFCASCGSKMKQEVAAETVTPATPVEATPTAVETPVNTTVTTTPVAADNVINTPVESAQPTQPVDNTNTQV